MLGQYSAHRHIAISLGLPGIRDGETMAARVVQTSGPSEGGAEIDGRWWRLCAPDESPTMPAPTVPAPAKRDLDAEIP